MKNTAVIMLQIGLLGVAGCVGTFRERADFEAVRRFAIESVISIGRVAEGNHLKLWVPVPHDSNNQMISDFEVVPRQAYTVEEFGSFPNRVLVFDLPASKASDSEIAIRFVCERREWRNLDDQGNILADRAAELDLGADPVVYLRDQRRIPVSGRGSELIGPIVEGCATDLEKARTIYDYVLDQMDYDKTGEGWGRGDFNYACDVGKGNCTDFHALFLGLCRAAGIPARFRIGLSLPSDPHVEEGKLGGYHCWAAFFTAKTGWLPVDNSEADKALRRHDPELARYYFGNLDENRVVFTEGVDIEIPGSSGKILDYLINPYAELDGVPFAGVSKTTTFRALSPR